MIKKIISDLKTRLANLPENDELTVNLIRESIQIINTDEVRVYVSPGHIDSLKNLVSKDKILSAVIKEYRERKCVGGAIVEDMAGRFSVDNTFDTRIEKLLPQIMPEISRELFG